MKKSILLLVPVLVLSGCNSGDKAKTVIEYLKDPKAMVADQGHCRANPAEENTAKCKNADAAMGQQLYEFSPFYKCMKKSSGNGGPDFTSDKACIDRVAKEEHMLP